MASRYSTYSTRSMSIVLVAALVGFGLWLLAPWGGGGGSGSSGGRASASLPPSLRVGGNVQVESHGWATGALNGQGLKRGRRAPAALMCSDVGHIHDCAASLGCLPVKVSR